MSTKVKKDVQLGHIDLDDDEFERRHTKIRVTTMIDEDALTSLKDIARERATPYQTLLNQVVRSFVSSTKGKKNREKFSESEVRSIVRDELQKAGA